MYQYIFRDRLCNVGRIILAIYGETQQNSHDGTSTGNARQHKLST